MSDMKWLDPDIVYPCVNKKYLTLDSDGRMIVREYHALKIVGKTSTGRIKVHVADNEYSFDLFGFIANRSHDYNPYGGGFMLATKVVYYMQLPEVPDIKGSVSYMNKEIKRLSDRVRLLEELLRNKEDNE